MNAEPPSLTRDLLAAMDWWRDAGVDLDFADDATVWTGSEDAASAQPDAAINSSHPGASGAAGNVENDRPAASKIARADLLGDSPPASLADFHTFWMEAPGLDGVGPRGRIAPRGNANADTMFLVVDPEEADRETLLSGPQGALLANMMAAMGIAPDSAYISSALPRHTPMADTPTIAAGGMDAVTSLHIQLAQPKRIIALGSGILPLIGHDQAQGAPSLPEINHAPSGIPVLVSEGLDSMMSMPRLKSRFWRRWIEWSAQ
ncbi:uracil-DNA glycosylase family protein [Erythrobacter sp. MTPC3]|uniref:uracil-DNA glycosylase family protein n=1 Tax=Erythrobacter sp. MTPC3 TaxID=3056564 RepID=UPI0036F20318